MDGNKLKFTSKENPTSEEIDRLRTGLRAYNQEAAGQGNRYSLFHSIENEQGKLVGGIYGKVGWEWLYIDLLWVEESYRGKGFGTQLMNSIEKEANKKGIFRYHIATSSFQAPEFYKKLGYEVCGQIEDLPPGFTNYFLKKTDI